MYQDLNSDAYEAGYLVNEAGKDWWRLNRTDLSAKVFSPEAATRSGIRPAPSSHREQKPACFEQV